MVFIPECVFIYSKMKSLSDIVDTVSQVVEKHPNTIQYTATAITASVITTCGILSYQSKQRKLRSKGLKEQLKNSELHSRDLTSVGTASLHNSIIDKESIEQQLSLNTAFLGTRSKKLRDSFVIVVGAGGVGSWAALLLLRAGVRKIRIIDFDQVTLSSLNRHAVAILEDVGTPKVRCIKKHFAAIAPFVEVDERVELLNATNVNELLEGQPDYVIDAIDNINTKIDLISYCYNKKLPIISSMGAGAKCDPSRIQIADISETSEDPLARTVRKKLKKLGIEEGVAVAYSTEKPHHVKLLPLEEEKVEDREEFSALPDFRARILPVLGTIPSMFGMSIAQHIILKLTEYPNYDPLPIKLRDGLYTRLHRELMTREAKTFGEKESTLDARDIAHIFEYMWHGKSVLSGPNDKLTLTRWNRSKPLGYLNTVCMTRTEANEHDKLPVETDLKEHYGKQVYDSLMKKFDNEQRLEELWDYVI
ncbi:hypothetical protein BDB01DRAFT_184646 [Pilobolus umbonatus]|nr:hypothetical protein BDB01DRAFT_184646 [Pilobolus umbonatus]